MSTNTIDGRPVVGGAAQPVYIVNNDVPGPAAGPAQGVYVVNSNVPVTGASGGLTQAAADLLYAAVTVKHTPQIIVAADGTGDYTSLVTALAAVPAGGATVLVKRGTYTLAASLSVPAKTTLRGEGMLATIIQAPLSTVNALTIAGADVTLEDLQIDGLYASQTNGGSQSTQCGIYLNSGAHRLRLHRVYLHDTCGHGVSNITNCNDLKIDDCRITNLGVAASQVQATPAPTTTTFAVAPGAAARFSVGQVLRIGTQAGTILSIQSVNSAVAAVSSTTVFTVEAGYGVNFSNGQVLRIGSQTGTISSIATDTITLTAPLTTIPIVGQIVGIDIITLTGAITTPSAGDVVAVAGGYLKGVYCGGTILRPRITKSFFSGWSQAIGLWFGVSDGLVEGNSLVANYGYEESAHTTNRSALELYPNNAAGGRTRVIGNLFDGSTHNCIECAQGEVATVFEGNTFRNWAQEAGLGNTGVAIEITGQAGIPGNTTDINVLGNTFISNGAFQSVALSVNAFTARIKIATNQFTGFSCFTSVSVIYLGGDGLVAITGNTFAYCMRPVFVSSVSLAGGTIEANQISSVPTLTTTLIELATCGDGWLISTNSIDAATSGSATGLKISSGNRHRVVWNRIKATQPILLTSITDAAIIGNDVSKALNDGSGAIKVAGASLRNNIRQNTVSDTGGFTISLEGTSDYNVVQDNQFPGHTAVNGDVRVTSSGTHNIVEPNSTNSVYPMMTLKALGAQTVGTSPVTVAHGLGYTPTQVLVSMTSAGSVWESAVADATNVTLTADSAGRTAKVYVR